MSDRPLTVLLAAESAYGPTNNCIGIGAELTMPLDLFFTELAARGMIPLDRIDD